MTSEQPTPETYAPVPASALPVSGFSIASLILGIVAVLLMGRFGLFGMLAVALGVDGIRRANRGLNSGRGLAIAGVILGGVGLVLTVLRIANLFL